MISFGEVIAALRQRAVDFVVTGVWGANYYTGGALFMTKDQDLFLPPDATNLLRAWQACESVGLSLDCNDEPLDAPRDLSLAETTVGRRALTTARGGLLLVVDPSLVMAGTTFERVARHSRVFREDGVDVPVASLHDIVAPKAAANRPKDRLFLATHAAELKRLLGAPPPSP